LALILGASIVLGAMWKGRREEKLLQTEGAIEHGKI